ncbi:MAG: DUF2510 domain-containing protein [Propionibacteriaceae bacterium]|jgi:hypothetical protein|nr:DUF2510 domain-containing protein [Propionibacteriaceae bacterium]
MASGLPGWYPDPGGEPGQFRYWDGQAWSTALSPTPYAPPPTAGLPGVVAYRPGQAGVGGTFGATGTPYPASATLPPAKKRFPVGILVTVAIIVVAIGLVVGFVVPKLTDRSGTDDPSEEPTVIQGTTQTCPTLPSETPPHVEHADDGWVHGGRLAFPQLTDPWSPIDTSEGRVPFGRDVAEQEYLLHYRYDGVYSWVASVLVGELYAGDGFYDPQEGADIVTRCVLGEFYSDAVVTRNDTRNEAYSLDGYDGWIIQSTLSFDIPNLPTTSEDITIIVVATAEMSSSLFYASVPTDSPDQIKGDVNYVIDTLKVSD